jgi:hypothetical protein
VRQVVCELIKHSAATTAIVDPKCRNSLLLLRNCVLWPIALLHIVIMISSVRTVNASKMRGLLIAGGMVHPHQNFKLLQLPTQMFIGLMA